ncbi:MAG: hypothetical protein QW505_05425 [Thermoplasmata archaeon]
MPERYGVVICPICGTPVGADLRKRTMTCVCGGTIELLKVKPKFESASPVEVARMVALAKSQAAEGKMELPTAKVPRSRLGKIAEKAKEIKDTQERLSFIASSLTRLKGDFSIEDLEKLHELIGKESANDMLVAMREGGIAYESAKGRYRSV